MKQAIAAITLAFGTSSLALADGPQTVDAPFLSSQSDSLIHLTGRMELPRLVDLVAEQLDLNIEYDEASLRGAVTLRLAGGITEEELVAFTNRVLASRGFTTVRLPGEDMLSVVKLSDAPMMARIEATDDPAIGAGYVKRLVAIENQPIESAVELLKALISKPAGTVQAVPTSGQVLLGDLTPHVNQIVALLRTWDEPGRNTSIVRLRSEFIPAAQLVSQIEAAAKARDLLAQRPLRGRVMASSDDHHVVLVVPDEELEQWRMLIALFDQRESVETRMYSPTSFGLDEVQQLIEQTAREEAPRGAGDDWTVVVDRLTGTLVVTATRSEHDRIEALLERLSEAPAEARRPMRAFPVRNRSVLDVLGILQELISTGALASASSLDESRTDYEGSGGSRGSRGSEGIAQAMEQRTVRPGATAGIEQTTNPGFRGSRDVAPPSARETRSDASTGLELTADEGTNTLIAIGEARLLDQIATLLKQLDVRQPQVMLEVLVISLSDSDTFDLGVELRKLEVSGGTMIRLASLFGLSTGDLANGNISAGGAGFSGVILNPGDFAVVIRALETLNEGRSLNIPKLLVNNNEQGVLNSVLQQPFVSTNASDTVATTSFGGTHDAGTTVSLRPQIAEGDHLRLEYSASLSAFVGDSSDPGIPPPRQQNSLQSVVTIPDGFTIAVGGIEITSDFEAVNQVPFLGSIPGIGELFKSRSVTRSRSRFFVFIRPTILRGTSFEDLKYLSDRALDEAVLDDGWPDVRPRIIR